MNFFCKELNGLSQFSVSHLRAKKEIHETHSEPFASSLAQRSHKFVLDVLHNRVEADGCLPVVLARPQLTHGEKRKSEREKLSDEDKSRGRNRQTYVRTKRETKTSKKHIKRTKQIRNINICIDDRYTCVCLYVSDLWHWLCASFPVYLEKCMLMLVGRTVGPRSRTLLLWQSWGVDEGV